MFQRFKKELLNECSHNPVCCSVKRKPVLFALTSWVIKMNMTSVVKYMMHSRCESIPLHNKYKAYFDYSLFGSLLTCLYSMYVLYHQKHVVTVTGNSKDLNFTTLMQGCQKESKCSFLFFKLILIEISLSLAISLSVF